MEVFDLQGKASIDISPYVSGIKEATQMNEALVRSLEATGKKVDALGDTISQTKGSVDKLTDALDKQGKETEDEGKASDEAAEETKKLGKEIQTTGDHSEKATPKIKELADGIKNGLATAAKVGAAAVGAAATGVGALLIRHFAEAALGKAITSRKLLFLVNNIAKRSKPMASPPCGGVPYLRASTKNENLS